ncbi:MAG: hypothetical protein R2764_01620 [Bacteroidales bacterium]
MIFLFEDSTKKYIKYNGQLKVLEYVLNNIISNIYGDSLIEIEDGGRSNKLYFHNVGEPYETVYISNVGDDDAEPLYIGNYEDYIAEYDFIVRVHQSSITTDHRNYIKSIVDKFKIAGKKYSVLSLSE